MSLISTTTTGIAATRTVSAAEKNRPFPVATPINKNHKSTSNRDYREQGIRLAKGQQLMWDDAKGNPTKQVGGYFAFVHNGVRITFHVVTSISPPSLRLPTWSANVGQTDRNALFLSDPFHTMSWDQWLSLGAPKKIQGTTRIVSAGSALKNHLKPMAEYVDETGEIVFNSSIKVG